MEELKRYVFDGEEYISRKSLLKCLREISDAVNSFSDRADPIRAQGANKVISLLLEKIEPPQEHWKPSEEQMEALKLAYEDAFECPESCVPHLPLKALLNDLKKLM